VWPPLPTSDLVTRIGRDVERSILRARNGLRYAQAMGRPRSGATPKDVVWSRGRAELWRYRGGPIKYDPPVLIVHSLVSRSYILDLRAGSSSVEHLLDAGFDVFMLDWGIPDERDADNSFETYVDDYIPRAVAAAHEVTGSSSLTMMGYCLGGVLAILYAAGEAGAAVRNLILLATPVDFREMGSMVAGVLAGRLDTEDLIDETGNVPADVLYSGFYMQAPTKELAQYATLLENLWNDQFVDAYQAMAQWSRDHVPLPGAATRQIVEGLIRENVLMTGRWRLGGRTIELADVQADVLNAVAERDKVVPRSASEPIMDLVGDPAHREQMLLTGGHVTFGAGSHALRRTLPRLSAWIAEHSDELDPPKER
jgi:poly[(R)-3-hydroxyalkanoate] polymerase subunit PhaC